jgi:hypothetical protein
MLLMLAASLGLFISCTINDYSHSLALSRLDRFCRMSWVGVCLAASGVTYNHTRAARHTALSRCRSQPVGEPPTDRLLRRLWLSRVLRELILCSRAARFVSFPSLALFALLPPHDGPGKNGSRSRQTFPVRREKRKNERRSSGKRVKTRHNSQA